MSAITEAVKQAADDAKQMAGAYSDPESAAAQVWKAVAGRLNAILSRVGDADQQSPGAREALDIADEIERVQFAFDARDDRRAALCDLAKRVRVLSRSLAGGER